MQKKSQINGKILVILVVLSGSLMLVSIFAFANTTFQNLLFNVSNNKTDLVNNTVDPAMFSSRNLAYVQAPHEYDVEYAKKYLTLRNNYSDLVFFDINDRDNISAIVKFGNKMDTLRGYLISSNRYAIDLVGCDPSDGRCGFRINGVPTKKLNKGQSFNISDTHQLLVSDITIFYCDEKVYCDLDFDAYHVVNISIVRR